MSQFASVDEILDFAIDKEREAQVFYTKLAAQVPKAHMKKLFGDFAAQEKTHEEKLKGIKAGGRLKASKLPVPDLKISEYLTDVDLGKSGDMEYQEALTVAMKREKAAFMMYTDLANLTPEPDIKETFVALAQEEAHHKLYLETQYDEYVYREN